MIKRWTFWERFDHVIRLYIIWCSSITLKCLINRISYLPERTVFWAKTDIFCSKSEPVTVPVYGYHSLVSKFKKIWQVSTFKLMQKTLNLSVKLCHNSVRFNDVDLDNSETPFLQKAKLWSTQGFTYRRRERSICIEETDADGESLCQLIYNGIFRKMIPITAAKNYPRITQK